MLLCCYARPRVGCAPHPQHLNGENCASDPHELVFTEDGPGPTLMGVVQIPLITGEALDLSCEDNILVCDIALPVLIMSGVIVFLLNIIQLVRLPATVKVLLHRLHKGDRSFMPTTVAASMHTNKEFGLVYAVKFGGWQTAYSVSVRTPPRVIVHRRVTTVLLAPPPVQCHALANDVCLQWRSTHTHTHTHSTNPRLATNRHRRWHQS